MGLIVGKKTARHAVDRNYMKRVLRELFRKNQHDIPHVDIVIRTQRPFNHLDFDQLVQEFTDLMLKLNRKSAQFSAHPVAELSVINTKTQAQ